MSRGPQEEDRPTSRPCALSPTQALGRGWGAVGGTWSTLPDLLEERGGLRRLKAPLFLPACGSCVHQRARRARRRPPAGPGARGGACGHWPPGERRGASWSARALSGPSYCRPPLTSARAAGCCRSAGWPVSYGGPAAAGGLGWNHPIAWEGGSCGRMPGLHVIPTPTCAGAGGAPPHPLRCWATSVFQSLSVWKVKQVFCCLRRSAAGLFILPCFPLPRPMLGFCLRDSRQPVPTPSGGTRQGDGPQGNVSIVPVFGSLLSSELWGGPALGPPPLSGCV